MSSLKEVIAAVERELDRALGGTIDAREVVGWQVERVVLALAVSIQDRRSAEGAVELSFDVLDGGVCADVTRAHSLTIELKRPARRAAAMATEVVAGTRTELRTKGSKKNARLEGNEAAAAMETLSSLFGAPGFDSSARATVFREAFGVLSEGQTRALIRSFSAGPLPGEDGALKSARHLLNGIMRSGPLQSREKGEALLAELLARHALKPVLELILERWKTHEKWLNEPAIARPAPGQPG